MTQRVDVAEMIVRDAEGRVLLVLGCRGLWGFPGGAREEGETFAEAAVRETREETGLEVELEALAAVLERRHELFLFFHGRIVGGTAAPQEDEDVVELRWVGDDEARELVVAYGGLAPRLLAAPEGLYLQQ